MAYLISKIKTFKHTWTKTSSTVQKSRTFLKININRGTETWAGSCTTGNECRDVLEGNWVIVIKMKIRHTPGDPTSRICSEKFLSKNRL